MEDEAARFSELYRRHYDQLLAFALRRIGPERAQDVVAEAFMAAWRHLRSAPEEPLPWLYRFAANTLANQRRSLRRQVALGLRVAAEPDAANVVADHAERVVEADRVAAALRRLGDNDREALQLVAWEGLDVTTAAYVAGCSTTAMKVRLHRARRRLARLLLPASGSPARADGSAPHQEVSP